MLGVFFVPFYSTPNITLLKNVNQMNLQKFRLMPFAALLLLTACKRTLIEPETKTPTEERSVFGNSTYKTTIGTNVQEFTELPSAQVEQDRLKVRVPWTNYEATGIYVAPNATLNITVTQLQGTRLPVLMMGTKLRDSDPGNPVETQLTAGVNNISGGQYGGLVWIRYTTTSTPNSRVRINFNSGHQRAAVFIKNQTTPAQWASQLSTYTAPDVLMVGDRVIQVFSRSTAQTYQSQDNNYVISTADKIWEWEHEISGMDGSAPQHQLPVHNRMLMVQTLFPAHWYGVAVNHATAYFPGATSEVFTPTIGQIAGWGVWHEFGHQHQSPVWYWDELIEVAVNIYSLKVERELGIYPSRLKRDNIWPGVVSYLANTASDKNFNTGNYMSNSAFIRLAMYHQLWLAYGDDFFIKLHKKARVDNPTNSNTYYRMRNFMVLACQVTGHNLTNFFRKWGFKTANVSGTATSLEPVYTEIANLNLPQPPVEPSNLTEDNMASGIVNGGIYRIVSGINNSSVLDVNSNTPVNGTLVSLWSANNPVTNNQRWLARPAGNGYFILKSMADTTKVMDVTGASSANGTQITVYTYHGGTAQQWKPTFVGDGNFNLSPACATDKNLDVNGGSVANGTKIQIWTKNPTNAQKFKLVKLN